MFRDYVHILPRFIQKAIYEHDISHLDLRINTTQTRILMFVNANSGKSMSGISSLLGLEKSSFTRSVDHLVRNGFVSKNFPEHDRRKIKLSLTEKGARAARLIQKDFDRYFDTLIAGLSAQEKKEFLKILKNLSSYITKITETSGEQVQLRK